METIETKRLTIRRFTPNDWEDLYEYLSDEEVVKFEPYGTLSLEACKIEAISRTGNPAFWAVCLKESGKVIGNLYFTQESPVEFMTWELGYVFNANYQHHGYATESSEALIKYAFEQMGVRRIIACCDPKNTASWRLLERLNMRREAHQLSNVYFKQDDQGNPIWKDTYQYAILASEYKIMNA